MPRSSSTNQSDTPLVFTSASNTLTDAVDNVRLDLIGAGNQPVTVSIRRDEDAIVSEIQNFVTRFNDVISTLDNLTSFDPETEARGILQGDSTARRVRSALLDLTTKSVPGLPSTLDRLSSIGVTLSGGTSLSLDEDKLRAALANDPQGVQQLFAQSTTDANGDVTQTGLGGIIQSQIDRLTDSDNGAIPLKEQSLQTSEDQLNGRIDQLQLLLDRRRERLTAQFNATELIIARLQSQQSALSGLGAQSPSGLLG